MTAWKIAALVFVIWFAGVAYGYCWASWRAGRLRRCRHGWQESGFGFDLYQKCRLCGKVR